jgi:hypothetical protein
MTGKVSDLAHELILETGFDPVPTTVHVFEMCDFSAGKTDPGFWCGHDLLLFDYRPNLSQLMTGVMGGSGS